MLLRNVRVPHTGKAHNYPKFQLSYLLLIEHWRTSKHVIWTMMRRNIHIFNEEYGEVFFSILGRSVLGDHVKSKFDHIRRLYRMLPQYREIKNDILSDQNTSGSKSGRHIIDLDSDEVRVTKIFFQNVIRQVVSNKYKSYNGTKSSFSNRTTALSNLTCDYIPVVYHTDVLTLVNVMFRLIKTDIEGFFLYNFTNIWPEADLNPDEIGHIGVLGNNEVEVKEVEVDIQDDDWGACWNDCKIGWFAVVRFCFGNGKGIKVMKVRKINAVPVMEDGNISDEVYESFSGSEWFCVSDNRLPSCLSQTWAFHAAQSRILHEIFNYSVIVYFEKLEAGGKIPFATCEVVREYADSNLVFEITD